MKNLDLNQNNISLSCCWKRAHQFIVKKGLELKLGLYDFELNLNLNCCFVLLWRPVISSTSKPKIDKCMGQHIMPFHAVFFLMYCTVQIQILLTSYFCHIFDVLGRKRIFTLGTCYMPQMALNILCISIILFNTYKPMRLWCCFYLEVKEVKLMELYELDWFISY